MKKGKQLTKPKIASGKRAQSFPAIAKSGEHAGRTVLVTRSVRTYSGYAILRRAMRNIALRRFR